MRCTCATLAGQKAQRKFTAGNLSAKAEFSEHDSPAQAGGLLDGHKEGVAGGSQDAKILLGKGDSTLPAGGTQTFLLSNIQRLITPTGKTKSKFLSDQAELKNALLVAVTETWLHSGVFDAEVLHDFPGYALHRCDRAGRQGGGVALYLRNDLTGEVLGSADNGVCEMLIVKHCSCHYIQFS